MFKEREVARRALKAPQGPRQGPRGSPMALKSILNLFKGPENLVKGFLQGSPQSRPLGFPALGPQEPAR